MTPATAQLEDPAPARGWFNWADRAIPGAGFGLISNAFDTVYNVAKLTGNVPNILETQISTYQRPYFNINVYDASTNE